MKWLRKKITFKFFSFISFLFFFFFKFNSLVSIHIFLHINNILKFKFIYSTPFNNNNNTKKKTLKKYKFYILVFSK